MKLWQKKDFNIDKAIEKFTVGNENIIDQKLVKYDCIASIAHAKALHKAGILNKTELSQLIAGLEEIMLLDSKGEFKITVEQEDCHTAIENHLTKKLGKLGKKIHTGRSRNDQIIVALRLYERHELEEIISAVSRLIEELNKFSSKNSKIPIPGYTHLRKAMPYAVGKWAEAFSESFRDDLALINSAKKLINQNPLGSAAGYGVPVLNIDRNLTQKLLGFDKVQNNTLYVQNSRGKFELMVLNSLNNLMLDINKLSTDLWLFTSSEFGYFELPKEFSMGSSIMPHKANPDVLEIARAKAGMMKSYCDAVNNIILNLPSGYNGDFKLTKEPLFNGIEMAGSSADIMAQIINGLKVNEKRCREAMTSELYTAEEAAKLVKQGMPFREAYQEVASGINKKKQD